MNEMSDEELLKLASDRLMERVRKCGEEIQEVLTKYRCTMQPVFEMRQGQVSGRVEVVPID